MRTVLSCAALAALCGLAGCGSDGPALTDVTGTVTLDGKPVPNATVTFTPEGEGGSPSYGTTDAQGNYTLRFSRDREGALPGRHGVQVTTEKVGADDVPAGEQPPEFVKLPQKYASPGELAAEVREGGNDIDFELSSK